MWEGKLFGEGNAKLPLPPMLMFDRITEIKKDTGEFNKGFIKAELDIKDNLWFLIVILKKIHYARLSWLRCDVAVGRILPRMDR